MPYSQDAWTEIAPLFDKIVALPFNRELAAGTLGRERFVHYMIQDAHYLAMFSRALAVAAAKAPDADGQVVLSHAAHDAIVVERALHEDFFVAFSVDAATVAANPPTPTCFAYGHFLVSTATTGSFAVALGALLPCFHIYREVGLALLAVAAPDNPYQKWIDTYSDADYAAAVDQVIAVADRAHEVASAAERIAMHRAYLDAVRLEWMFWDAAWRLETWPV
jgi:thiaminase/transcriptional activator TenA